jgi:Tfp pilus assembly protein PilN
MKAVNLIPSEDRRGGGSAAGRSGGAVYVVLGALALLVLVVALYAQTSHKLGERRTALVTVEQQAKDAEATAAALQGYAGFAQLRQKRIDTVRSIAASRFDWSFAMHEVARTIPSDVSLTSLVGTVAPGVPLQGAGGSGGSLRGAVPSPAIELAGCTTSQANVARMMAAMRQVDGVRRVSLQSSTKGDSAAGGGGSGAAGACGNAGKKDPQFAMVIFFDPKPAPAAPAAAATAQTASAPTTTTTPEASR